MSNENVLSVAVIGVPPHEQNVLRRIFGLTSSRTRCYALVSSATEHAPDILLVDGDDQAALTEWRELCTRDQATAKVATVMLSKADVLPDAQLYHLQRPLLAPRVLAILDQITVEARPPIEATPQHKALVVDDSLTVRKQVELELQQLGVEVDCAESGEEAFEHLQSGTAYDVIFLDVIMPGVDGYNVCKAIKRDKQHKQIPVIMLTGKDSPFDRVRGKLAGCDTYLTKPVTREAFQDAVKKHLPQLVRNEVSLA